MAAQFEAGDMVKLAAPEKFRNSLIFKENVFKIVAMYDEGIKLSFSDQIVTAADILPVKIDGAEDRSIYYDPIIAASIVLPGQPIPVHHRDYTYYFDAFAKMKIEKSDKTLQDLVREQNFEYVHEIQHFLRQRYQNDELEINYTL